MTNVLIASTTIEGLEPLGNPGQRSHELLKGVLREHLSQHHADLLAEPVTSPDGLRTDWYCDGPATRLLDLPETDQETAKAELARLMTDIEDLARNLGDGRDASNQRLSAALGNVLEIPDETCVHVRVRDPSDGGGFQPVLVNWSHRQAEQSRAESVLSTMVPRRPRMPPPGPPPIASEAVAVVPVARTSEFPWWLLWWLGWLVTGIAVAYLLWLLVLPCGVRLPFGGTLNFCPAAVAEVDGSAARQAQLEADVAALELELATLEGQCQAPVVAEVPEEVVEEPVSEIERRLERENAEQGELSFSLAWNHVSDLDLAVYCPNGVKISFSKRTVNELSCTGNLDTDANFRSSTAIWDPVENVFFPDPVAGRYRVEVKLYSNRGDGFAHDFVVRILDRGQSQELRGRVSVNDEIWRYAYDRQ